MGELLFPSDEDWELSIEDWSAPVPPLRPQTCFSPRPEEKNMKSTTATAAMTPTKMFLDIPNAAGLAGFSTRHFRRIIEEERIRIVQIGRKFFIMGADFDRWQSHQRAKHVDLHQTS